MPWVVPKIWEGGDVWILGGGPSVTEQFGIPKRTVQEVVEHKASPSIYSSYMSKLHDKHVIGINVSYLIGDWIDIVFFGDAGFFLQHQNALAKFPNIKASCYPGITKYDWVKYLSRDNERKFGISKRNTMVSWNFNSGAAAISLAVHTGAKRIYLLGFDMKLGAENTQHWHNVYNRSERSKQPKNLPFERHLQGFPYILKDATALGVEIINVSPNSAIECFPKVHLNDVV